MPFKHPGTILGAQTVADAKARIAAKVPITLRALQKLGWETPLTGVTSSAVPVICVMWANPPANIGDQLAVTDAPMAYRQALSFVLTGNAQYAINAMNIIGSWVTKCTICTGDNRQLDAAWSQVMFARAVELLKFYYKPFAASGLEARYVAWVVRVMLPVLKTPFQWTNNWSAAVCEARMQIAVLRDDAAEFAAMIAEFKRIVPIMIRPDLLSAEITRDFLHAQMAMGSLLQICELAWHQGVDLYGFNGGIVAKHMEAMAGVLLGQPLPAGLQGTTIKALMWCPYGWSIGWNHYGGRKGLPMPNVQKVVQGNPVEFSWLCWSGGSLTHR